MKPVQVKEVTDQLIKEFSLAYWQHCGVKEDPFMVESYADSAIASFTYGIENKNRYIDGVRWDIQTGRGVWPHVKVRYKITDTYGEKAFSKEDFVFIVYVNAITNKEMYPEVKLAVQSLVKKLEKDFPVVAEL